MPTSKRFNLLKKVNTIVRKIGVIPFYPFLIALFPALRLLDENFQEIHPSDSLRSIIFLLVLAGVILAIFSLLTRNVQKAAAVSSVILLLFLSYGHVYTYLKQISISAEIIGRHRYLVPTFLFLGAVLLWVILKREINFRQLTTTGNIMGFTLFVLPLISIINQLARMESSWDVRKIGLEYGETKLDLENIETKPDIYYIILDAYTRSDHLLKRFDVDNSDFLDYLETHGFFIADESHTNYIWTSLSLGSSLNMNYVQDIGVDLTFGNYPTVFMEPIRHSLVRALLEDMGYKTIALRTGFIPTEIIDADYYMGPGIDEVKELRNPLALNAFEGMLLRSTAGRLLWDFSGDKVRNWVFTITKLPFSEKRQVVLAQLANLKEIVSMEGPKFVFTHITIPHPPFVFGPNGEEIPHEGPYTLVDQDKEIGYPRQAIFITSQIKEVVESILEGSSYPPIIIIQGDHGPNIGPGPFSPGSERVLRRAAILNVYHLPDGCNQELYPTITPVNSFRVIFRCNFGLPIPLLEDKTYYSPWPKRYPYEFVLIDTENQSTSLDR